MWSPNKLLNDTSICRWFETPLYACDVPVIRIANCTDVFQMQSHNTMTILHFKFYSQISLIINTKIVTKHCQWWRFIQWLFNNLHMSTDYGTNNDLRETSTVLNYSPEFMTAVYIILSHGFTRIVVCISMCESHTNISAKLVQYQVFWKKKQRMMMKIYFKISGGICPLENDFAFKMYKIDNCSAQLILIFLILGHHCHLRFGVIMEITNI